MQNGMRQDAPIKRHPRPGEVVVDRLGQEFTVKQRGMKYIIMEDGSWKAPQDVRLKEPDGPVEKKLSPDEEFLA